MAINKEAKNDNITNFFFLSESLLLRLFKLSNESFKKYRYNGCYYHK